MKYNTYAPSNLLSPYVKFYWTLEGLEASMNPPKERIFPDGSIELLFHCGDLFQKYMRDDQVVTQPRSFLHGQITRFIDVRPTGKIEIFSIRFQPHGLYPFLNYYISELTGITISTNELWGLEGQLLEERIMEAGSATLRIQVIEEFLLQRLKLLKRPQNDIMHCVRLINHSNGSIPIEKLAYEVNTGRRELERKFLEQVGISPKLLARITRFQKVLNKIETEHINSTAAAYEGGFYDQSHFIRDFKEFTGYSPNIYFAKNMEFTKHLTS